MGLYLGDKLIASNLAGGDTNPIGSVIAFAGSNAPVGYLMCDGSAVSRETYAELFAVIGTTYGSGDGSTTFNLPNAQGRTLVGVDGSDADFDLADTGGSKGAWQHNHTMASAGSHTHRVKYDANNSGSSGQDLYGVSRTKWSSGGVESAGAHTHTINSNGSANNTLPVDKANMPPFLSLNYIIKATRNVTIQGVDTMSEAEYEDLLERLV